MKAHADHPKAPGSNAGPSPDAKNNLQTLPISEVEKKLSSSLDGLTQAEAEKRLAQYGPNEIAEKKTNAILKFLSYFWGPIPWMIEAAVILSAAAGHWSVSAVLIHPLELWVLLSCGYRRGYVSSVAGKPCMI